jgi:uncharacterized lipoprotein YmbA
MNRLLVILLTLLMGGCAQPSKHYYILTAEGPPPSGGGVGIGVGPVAIAEYLDRPNLVVKESANSLGVAEDYRWAGDLSQGISRVMSANLGRELHSGNVRVYPWQRDDEIRYQVTLDVRQLHSDEDGYAVIEAGWRVYTLPEKQLKFSKTFVDREPLKSSGYDAMVAAESRLLARLSKNIANAIR